MYFKLELVKILSRFFIWIAIWNCLLSKRSFNKFNAAFQFSVDNLKPGLIDNVEPLRTLFKKAIFCISLNEECSWIEHWNLSSDPLRKLDYPSKDWISILGSFILLKILFRGTTENSFSKVFWDVNSSIKRWIPNIFLFVKIEKFVVSYSSATPCEKCPNTEFFLVPIFLYSEWIRRFIP